MFRGTIKICLSILFVLGCCSSTIAVLSGTFGYNTGGDGVYSNRCYECNSGNPAHPYKHCPADGQLVTDYLTSTSCDSFCFARTSKWEKGVIYRGCSKAFPLEQEQLSPGCKEIKGEMWCLCDGNECNTMDMSFYVEWESSNSGNYGGGNYGHRGGGNNGNRGEGSIDNHGGGNNGRYWGGSNDHKDGGSNGRYWGGSNGHKDGGSNGRYWGESNDHKDGGSNGHYWGGSNGHKDGGSNGHYWGESNGRYWGGSNHNNGGEKTGHNGGRYDGSSNSGSESTRGSSHYYYYYYD